MLRSLLGEGCRAPGQRPPAYPGPRMHRIGPAHCHWQLQQAHHHSAAHAAPAQRHPAMIVCAPVKAACCTYAGYQHQRAMLQSASLSWDAKQLRHAHTHSDTSPAWGLGRVVISILWPSTGYLMGLQPEIDWSQSHAQRQECFALQPLRLRIKTAGSRLQ